MLNFDININNNNFFRTIRNEKINFNSNPTKVDEIKRKRNYLKNVDKIKKKKDIEKFLFSQNKLLFNNIKNKLHTIYKEGKKISSKYFDQ